MNRKILLSIVLVGLFSSAYGQLSIENRYWKYKNQKTLLIGGWNHGHNPHIDHDESDANGSQGVSTVEQIKAAISEMVDAGGNLLRCVLNPGMAAGIQNHNFCTTSGGKYDMNDMTGPFWTRLNMFLADAESKGVVVQLEIWDRFDLFDKGWKSWPVSPFNPDNNINYTTAQSGLANSYSSYNNQPFLQGVPGHPVYEAASSGRKTQYDLVRGFQEKFVDKLLEISFKYNNVLYCMNNETHEDPKWGEYWIDYIRTKASAAEKNILVTEMLDQLYFGVNGTDWQYQSNNPDSYDYIDVSQVNSRHRDEASWNIIKDIADDAKSKDILLHMTKVYGSDLALSGAPWSGWKPGDSDNAIEEWWRSLVAGVAGIRIHRPTAGIGLNDLVKNNMKSVRLIENNIKFWDVEPHQELLGNRESDEAYVAANLGEAYILFYTANGQGSVTLDLSNYSGTDYEVSWVDVSNGILDESKFTTISGGSVVALDRPSAGFWVASIVKQNPLQASDPVPTNAATSISTDQILSWTLGSGATSHDVYFGTSSPPASIGNQLETSYDPGSLANNTTYYWRIDEVNSSGTTVGVEWRFTTQVAIPGQAISPDPVNGAQSVDVLATLSWTSGSDAVSHDVYFGTSNPPAFAGNQQSTSYNPGEMANGTMYYWRIDEVNTTGTTQGNLWSFTTALVTGIIDKELTASNYPNPFATFTNVQFTLKKAAFVNLVIYNTSGKLVADLIQEERESGSHIAVWNPTYSNGVSPGIYIYQLSVGDEVKTGKLLYRR